MKRTTFVVVLTFVLSLIVFSSYPVMALSSSLPVDTQAIGARDASQFQQYRSDLSKNEIAQNRRAMVDAISVEKFRDGFVAGVAVSVMILLICGAM